MEQRVRGTETGRSAGGSDLEQSHRRQDLRLATKVGSKGFEPT